MHVPAPLPSRDGTTKILISTDVLSRGFDVTQVWGQQTANCCYNNTGRCMAKRLPPAPTPCACGTGHAGHQLRCAHRARLPHARI